MSPPKITTAESQIMETLWLGGPQSADDIVRQVGPANAWGEATVRTLINRLLKKKALRSERAGQRVTYVAVLTRDEYLADESQGLLDRLFGGELAPLVAHFARHRRLSPDERARLKRLVEELDDDG